MLSDYTPPRACREYIGSAVDRSTDALTLQIGPAESPLSFYGENLGGRGFVTVLPTIALQAPLDRTRGELPSH